MAEITKMNEADVNAFANRLRGMLEDLRAQDDLGAEGRKTVELDQQAVGRLSRMDALQGQAMAQAAEQRRATEMARIDAALIRIDDGSYGECLRCGEDIAEGRLEVDPAATLCVDCARGR
jgi:DnaK suppressor protein